jgi:periplasmic copper chaperone A
MKSPFGGLIIPSVAAEYKVGSIEVDNPWSRATPKGAATGAGYMTIKNTGTGPDRLIAGTTDVSAGVQFHEMTMNEGVSKMREMKSGIEIKPGETVELKPGSSHVMFVNLKRRLEKGERKGDADV